MFGRRFRWADFPSRVPDWAALLVAVHCPAYAIAWKIQPRGRGFYGCCYGRPQRIVTIYGPNSRDCDESRMVVLHEIAHAIDNCEHAHDRPFWEIAARLYTAAGLLEYAADNERYAIGQKTLREIAGLPPRAKPPRTKSRPLILQGTGEPRTYKKIRVRDTAARVVS